MNHGAHSTHLALRQRLTDYLRSQYLGKSQVLIEACESELNEKGRLYNEPYIESSSAYKTEPGGIESSPLPDNLKRLFRMLSERNLGVFDPPYLHQVEALLRTWRGEDILVSTGTGSGKTECFLWPLIARLADEAHRAQRSWQEQRGVRALILYPMNALVSDQLARLRRLFGADDFVGCFRSSADSAVRRPQFGMYTSRTPYPGEAQLRANRNLAKTLRQLVNDSDPEYRDMLSASGKIPVKKDLQAFTNTLENTVDITPDPEDAELITRQEMQTCVPDILITNYSMLEYMLMRPIEDAFWDETRDWLVRNPDRKLLIILDEAHMYRGSAGGEVALLLRRLFFRLGIGRERVQFILTTASMPNETEEDKASVELFARQLTNAPSSASVSLIWGEKTGIDLECATLAVPEHALREIDLARFDENEEARLAELNSFRSKLNEHIEPWEKMKDACVWLYDHALQYWQFAKLLSTCRGNAVSLAKLAGEVFPETKDARALDGLLAVAPLARDVQGNVLFPVRMHMMFRGFSSVYACMNAQCGQAPGSGNHERTLGRAFFNSGISYCSCGGCVYEIYNDRRCGALYLHGYLSEPITVSPQYLWQKPGAFSSPEQPGMKEVFLMCLPPGIRTKI